MTKILFRDWELIVNIQLTKLTYDKAISGCADTCICNECKNFAKYRDNVFPNEIKQLFEQIGIDYRKESEICHYCKLENGLHLYGGWFHFKGHFTGKNGSIPLENGGFTLELTSISDKFSIGFLNSSALTFFDNKENLVQIEFDAQIPWIIEKELEY
jgi:hypothetical protein